MVNGVLEVVDVVETLKKYQKEARHMMDDIEDNGFMHSAEWYYYKGMIKAFNRALTYMYDPEGEMDEED